MNQLYWPAITPGMRKLMATFAMSRIGKSFYLAGGTAPTTIVRDRSNICNRLNLQTHRLHGTNCIFPAGARAFYDDIHFLDPHCLGSFDSLLGCQTGSKGCAFTRAFKTR